MLYRIFFSSGSQELVEADNLQSAKDLVDGYGEEIARIVALGGDDQEDDGFDDDDFEEDQEFEENPDDEDD